MPQHSLPAAPTFQNEDQFSAAVHQMIWNTYPILRRRAWHVANEHAKQPGVSDKQHRMQLSKRKACGVISGVWDWHIYHNGFHVIELKMKGNRLSEAQIQWRDAVQPTSAHVCYTLDEVKNAIEAIIQS